MNRIKQIFTVTLIIFTIIGAFIGMFDPELAWAKRLTYYLSENNSTSTKTFAITDTGADTTAVFEIVKNMSFMVNVVQPNDSVDFFVRLRLLPRNYADSTDWFADIDSARVTSTGPQLLKFRHFMSGQDSSYLQLPPADYGLLIATGTNDNGYVVTPIRLMGATEGDF